MASKSGDRSKYFPAIEKKYGEKIDFWFRTLKKLDAAKYPEQVGYLRENYGFSQAHANAIVMYFRGSTSSKRFNTVKEFYETLNPQVVRTVKKIFSEIRSKNPDLELVIAWNQPMLMKGKDYVFGLSVASSHILIAPWSSDVLESFGSRLSKYQVNKKTFAVPHDWKVDGPLLRALVKARLAEVK